MKRITLVLLAVAFMAFSVRGASEAKLAPGAGDAAMKAAIAKLGKSLFIIPQTEAAAGEFVALGECILPFLQEKISTSKSETERVIAACALGKLGDTGAFEALATAVENDESVAVRLFTARSLADLGDSRAVPVLIKRLDEEKAKRVHRFVCFALGTLKAKDAVAPLSKALDAGEDAAAIALGQIGDISALPALERSLKSEKEYLSLTAARAISRLEEQKARDTLTAAVRGDSWNAAKSAALVLGEAKDATAADPLCDALAKSNSIEVRVTAAQALGRIGLASSAEKISVVLASDNSSKVRAMAAWALGEIMDASYAAALASALGDSSPMVREAVRVALSEKFQAAAVPALSNLLKLDSPLLRLQAVNTLSGISTPDATAALETAAVDSDPEVRAAAAQVLKARKQK